MTALDHTPDLFALSTIRGPVLRPTDEGYDAEVRGFNLAVRHSPDVVVGATGEDDIVTALRWAAATGTPVAVQSTGHGANSPVDSGLLISTARMADVRVDAGTRTATIAAGAKWRDVLEAADPYGLSALTGTSTDVGAVGYTVGGGLPVLGRAYGYAADLTRSFRVVTPDGVLHTASATEAPELFWALRGGKGNVGVVTALTTDLIPVPRLLGGGIHCTGEHADTLLSAWTAWTETVPDPMCSAFHMLRLPPIPEIPEPLSGGFWARVAVAWPGDPAEGQELLAPLRSSAPVEVDTVAEMACTAIDFIHMEPRDPLPARESCALLRALPREAQTAFLHECGPSAPPDYPLLMVGIRHMGAALSRPPATPDAICARDARFLLEAVSVIPTPEATAAAEQATASLHRAVAPYGTGRTMVNIHGRPGDAKDRARAWTPETYARLREAKTTYDPSNLLRFGHAVPPAADAFPSRDS
ncbi:FAD-binding oxidoreductase [Streptomyces sp. NPDC057877]|uniref:FAD-binding oxidoreductase n=1 Tax=Streptomyces sp. NPDC057877 TaxID=3346269 RepID=UPI0036902353